LLGLGLGGGLDAYASAGPGVCARPAGAATALFVAGLGSIDYMIRSDLSAAHRLLFFLLLALIVYGFVSLFVSTPAGNVIYALVGLGIFGGYTLLDFNRLRRAGTDDVVSLATGTFLNIFNVFLFFLQLFGNRQQD
jgi:FtsH-binding integral membrane protein